MTQTPEPEAAGPADGPAPSAEVPPSKEGTSTVDDVLAQVRERGFITTGEIFAAFPDLEPDADELRNLWDMFESRGIKVLDEIAEELKLEDERRGTQGAPGSGPRPVRPIPRARASIPSACTSRRSARCRSSRPSRESRWPSESRLD